MSIKIEKILSAITENTRIIALLNPNNPIGNVYTKEDIERVIEKAKQVGAVLIIDEAYHYYYPNTFLPLALENDNVIILRTFSKAFSIPALRLGVIISNPKIIHYINNAKMTFDVNSIALLFGERLLDHPAILNEIVESESQGNRLATEKKVLVHPYRNDLLKDYLRVSVGSVESMKIFLNAFFEIDLNDKGIST